MQFFSLKSYFGMSKVCQLLLIVAADVGVNESHLKFGISNFVFSIL